MDRKSPGKNSGMDMAEKIRQACIEAAKEAFMDASISGLCTEGAVEAAIGAIQSVDLEKIVRDTGDS